MSHNCGGARAVMQQQERKKGMATHPLNVTISNNVRKKAREMDWSSSQLSWAKVIEQFQTYVFRKRFQIMFDYKVFANVLKGNRGSGKYSNWITGTVECLFLSQLEVTLALDGCYDFQIISRVIDHLFNVNHLKQKICGKIG